MRILLEDSDGEFQPFPPLRRPALRVKVFRGSEMVSERHHERPEEARRHRDEFAGPTYMVQVTDLNNQPVELGDLPADAGEEPARTNRWWRDAAFVLFIFAVFALILFAAMTGGI